MFVYCAKYFENYDFFSPHLTWHLQKYPCLQLNGNARVLNLSCDGRLMLTVPENLTSVSNEKCHCQSFPPGNEDKICPKKVQAGSWVILAGDLIPEQLRIPQLGSPQHRRAPAHDSASGRAKLQMCFISLSKRNTSPLQCSLGSPNYLMGCE